MGYIAAGKAEFLLQIHGTDERVGDGDRHGRRAGQRIGGRLSRGAGARESRRGQNGGGSHGDHPRQANVECHYEYPSSHESVSRDVRLNRHQ